MSLKIRVAYIPFGYPDYPRDLINRFLEESKNMLKDLKFEVVETRPVIVFEEAEEAAADLDGKQFDLIIANIISWVEAPNVIAVLERFKHKPIILWSHTMFKEGENSLPSAHFQEPAY